MTQRKKPKRPPQPGPEGRRQGRRHRAGQAGPLVAGGFVVIPFNRATPRRPPASAGAPDKVNVNLGTSRDFPQLANELRKGQDQLDYGATPDGPEHGRGPEEDPQDILAGRPSRSRTVPHLPGGRSGPSTAGVHLGMTEEDLFDAFESQALEASTSMTVTAA